ncbi:reverse transcriptase domain-containing protein [Tanacetum coccineum]
MLEGKLVLLEDDGEPLKPLNVDVATAGPNDIPSNKGEDDSVNVIESAKPHGTGPVSYANLPNGKRVVSNTCMEAMLENEPWLICNVPLIFRKWSPMVNVSKEDLKNVSVWAKLHNVAITTFTKDGLSVIATILADVKLKDTLIMALSKIEGNGNMLHSIQVKTQRKAVIGLPVGPKYRVVYKPIQPTNCKNSDTRHAKPKDTNSTKVGDNIFGSKTMVDVASPSGTKNVANYNERKIVTSNPFDILNMVEKDVGAAPSEIVCSKGARLMST